MNDTPHSIESEQSVLGALLLDNDAIDRIGDLRVEHFYLGDHRAIFASIRKLVGQGQPADVITVFEDLGDKVGNSLQYLNSLSANTPSSSNIQRYADIVVERAIKREIIKMAGDMAEAARSPEKAATILDRMASQVDGLAQKKTQKQPKRFSDLLSGYVDVLQARMEGKIKPIQTGFDDIDRKLGGGLERGTLTVVAARPAMGKTAFGLAIGRNVSEWGTTLFLSMEMDEAQIGDRCVGSLGNLPVRWLRNPGDENERWNRVSAVCGKSQDMNLFIDDQTSLTIIEIRNKARQIKRLHGLDCLVIDQLSFITGSQSDQQWQAIGEYTRGLIAIGKELGAAVVLLCQLNRDCERRNDKRPMLADLAMSGSIEQDAANVIFLYRDEVYDENSQDKGICEVNIAKQRQGDTGTVGLAYIGDQTRFESLARPWQKPEAKQSRRGIAQNL